MKLCIAEKPSVARDLAQILGASTRKEGYFEGNGYWVSWTFGHLCTLKEPEDYNPNWKQWRVEDLPISPEQFGIKVIKDEGVQRQFNVLKSLVAQCEEVINCGDAGQEGELIQRWVLLKAGCKVPVKRLWISSLTDEAIKEGFSKLKNGEEFDNLFAAGNSRAIGDWMLGINGTRLFEQKEGKEGNPRLYDLTSLQVDGNKRYGFSADETLKYVQSLYEKKLVTYPRVDTTYLSEDLHPKIPNVLKGLRDYSRFTESLLEKPIPKTKAIFDNSKVTDHHAIIPTGIVPSGISPDEHKIYDLIARRLIAAFYPECKVSNTTVMGQVDQLAFKATGKQVLDKGWRVVYEDLDQKVQKKGESEDKILPLFTEGEEGPHEPFMHQGKTSAPKPYTEATLLRAMETAGKLVEDEEMRELMKENGIGRPSTRSAIIETLFKRKYIEKKKKNLIATDTGMHLIDTIKNDLLKSPELTGQWEHKLRQMERGLYDPKQFKAELFQMVREITDEVIFGN